MEARDLKRRHDYAVSSKLGEPEIEWERSTFMGLGAGGSPRMRRFGMKGGGRLTSLEFIRRPWDQHEQALRANSNEAVSAPMAAATTEPAAATDNTSEAPRELHTIHADWNWAGLSSGDIADLENDLALFTGFGVMWRTVDVYKRVPLLEELAAVLNSLSSIFTFDDVMLFNLGFPVHVVREAWEKKAESTVADEIVFALHSEAMHWVRLNGVMETSVREMFESFRKKSDLGERRGPVLLALTWQLRTETEQQIAAWLKFNNADADMVARLQSGDWRLELTEDAELYAAFKAVRADKVKPGSKKA